MGSCADQTCINDANFAAPAYGTLSCAERRPPLHVAAHSAPSARALAAHLRPAIVKGTERHMGACCTPSRYKLRRGSCNAIPMHGHSQAHIHTSLNQKALHRTCTCCLGVVTCCRTWQPYLGFHARRGVGM